LAGVVVEAYVWDIPTDTDLIVGSEVTDGEGNAKHYLNTNDYHSFKFYVGGELQLATSRFKIVTTPLEYVLYDTEKTKLQEWLELQSVTVDLTYDNATDLITFTWDDQNSITDMFCLNVTASNGTSMNSACSTSLDGSLTYTIVEYNVSYYAEGRARYAESGNWYKLAELTVDKREGFRGWFGDTSALVIGMIIFLVIGMLALVNKNIAIVGGSLALILGYFFGIIPGLGLLMGVLALAAIVLMIINKRHE
jgi:hypothetical protein